VTFDLTLPYPVSANRYWRTMPIGGKKGARQIMIRSKEADAYRECVAWEASRRGIRAPIAGRVAINIRLYPQRPQDWAKRAARAPLSWDDDVRCIDLDNANKVLLDALKGVAIEDDRWVRVLSSERMEPDEKGARVEVRVMRLTTESPQASLKAEAA
jgi:crossover junction endodeoxyribonuclease RusA